MTGMDANIESLRQAGEQLAEVGNRLGQRWQALLADASGRGDIFDDDMVGGLIGASYFGAQDVADESFMSAIDSLCYAAETLGANADLFEFVEDDTTTTFNSIEV